MSTDRDTATEAPQERRPGWVDKTCTGCGAPVRRRASEVRTVVFCTRECYRLSGKKYMGVTGRGRPRVATTVTWECPDGVLRTCAIQGDRYVAVYWPQHPDANTVGRVYQHRIVMEQMLGRRLLPTESVHHRNGERGDNHPGNLELWSKAQPAGQRVEDKVTFAVEMLALYAPERLAGR